MGFMPDALLTFNPECALKIAPVGREQTPLVIIDDFAQDTAGVIDYACKIATFGRDTTSAYPGVRAQPPGEYLRSIVRSIAPILMKVYAVPESLRMRFSTFYSLIATPPQELQLLQRLPHFDSNRQFYFAITHFLSPREHGGTGLFRHNPTGFESVTEDRLPEYVKAGDGFLQANGDPRVGYFTTSDDHYTLYEEIDYRPNRLVAYPGSLLHSGLVNPQTDIDASPESGRLTGNVFIDFR
jgi:hypothetical protein